MKTALWKKSVINCKLKNEMMNKNVDIVVVYETKYKFKGTEE